MDTTMATTGIPQTELDAGIARIATKHRLGKDLVALLAKSRAGGTTTPEDCERINRFFDGEVSVSKFLRLNADLDELCGIDPDAAGSREPFTPEEAEHHMAALDGFIAAKVTKNGCGKASGAGAAPAARSAGPRRLP